MTVKPNASFTFSAYTVTHQGIELHFDCVDPGPGLESRYAILVTDGELASVTTQVQLRNLVVQKLQRAIRATGIASKLDQFLGQSVTI